MEFVREIHWLIHQAKNGQDYIWANPTPELVEKMIDKYGFNGFIENIIYVGGKK